MTTQLHLSITDNGCGFDLNTIKKTGNGLHNFKKRINELQGTYELHTAPGQGTVVRLNIPLNG